MTESKSISRRQWLAGMGTSFALAPGHGGPAAPARVSGVAGRQGTETPYDLLIKGGKVIDPSQGIEAPRDVAIRNGKVARVEADLAASQAREVVRADGKIVTPGLVDIHAHVFPHVGVFGIEPDAYCVHRGVTTVLDAGTTGAFSFAGLQKFVIERAATRIRALLHVVCIGLIAGNSEKMGELEDLRYCDSKLAVKVASEHRDLIVGIKVRLSDFLTGPNDLEGMVRARAAADETGLPLVIHIGRPYTPLREFLARMKKGDVVTHAFNGHPGGLLDDAGKLKPEVGEARARGVLFDVGHGMGSFAFEVMEKCLTQGFLPDTISSDLHALNIQGPVYDLATTLSKFLLLGLSLREVIERSTVRAAGVFNFGAEIGTLRPGAEADVGVFDLQEGKFTFTDAERRTRVGRQKLVPVATVRGGKVFYPLSAG